MNVELLKANGPTITAIIAEVLFFYNREKDKKGQKMQDLNNFLGNKEPVAFAAFKILREKGFKGSEEEKKEQIYTVIQGCLFEGSDRARAILYHVVNKYKDEKEYASHFNEAFNHLIETSKEIYEWKLSENELDCKNFSARMSVLRKIFKVV